MNEQAKGLIGLAGVLFACMAVDLNSQVTAVAAADIQGGLGLSHDPTSWLGTLYSAGECVGMATAAWWAGTFGLRRYLLAVVALCCAVSLAIPFTTNTPLLFAFRLVQGLAEGLTIPMLMAIALRVLPPPIRLYGLAAYALTATVFPYLGATVAALWTESLDWRFSFFQVIPMDALAAVLIWFGVPDPPPNYGRFRLFDWRGFVLLIICFGSLAVLLTQGDRLDWFNSRVIQLLALTAAASLPLLLLNEWFHELPFLKLQLLGRPNVAFGALGLFLFLLVSLGAIELPAAFLEQVQGFRPRQTHVLTLLIAAAQFVMLPAMALLLDREWVDARGVALTGLTLILAGLIGDSFVDATWQAQQFLPWQALEAVGAPMVVMTILMVATNSIKPPEGQFAAPLINTPRALAEIIAMWLVQMILRLRGAFHADQLGDTIGSARFRAPPAGGASGLETVGDLVGRETAVLTIADDFRGVAVSAVVMIVVVLVLPRRTFPPRIALANQ